MQLTTRLLILLVLSSIATTLNARIRFDSDNDNFSLQNAFFYIVQQLEANTKSYSQYFHYLPENYFLGYEQLSEFQNTLLVDGLLTFAKAKYAFSGDFFRANSVQEAHDDLERDIDQEVEQEIERDIEEDVERDVEEDVERGIEEEVERDVEQAAEHDLEQDMAREIEQHIEEDMALDPDFEPDFDGEFGLEAEPPLEDDVFEQAFDEPLDTDPEHEPELIDTENDPGNFAPVVESEFTEFVPESEPGSAPEPDSSLPVSADELHEAAGLAHDLAMEEVTQKVEDEIERQVEIVTNADSEKLFSGFWLVLGDEVLLPALEEQGFNLARKQYLPGLKQSLMLLQAPRSFNMNPDAFSGLTIADSADAVADFNHVYSLASEPGYSNMRLPGNSSDLIPSKVVTINAKQVKHRVGMIDSAINQQHALLKQATLHYRSFTAVNDHPDEFHGTAVASILVGKSGNYEGVAPGMPLWAASVFFRHDKEGTITTTEYVIRALDWLVSQNVSVINMSLAGPANRILQRVIDNLCNKGVVIVAAVGNAGSGARPQYPAAYACSVAVTAVSSKHRVYRNAVQGEHVDVAAYGVNLIHANSNGGIASSSGTSFATPLVSAYLAAHLPAFLPSQQQQQTQWLEHLYQQCRDLGKPGWDPVYGHGMLPPGEGML